VERKLAAILAADVVGYSRLMAENEADTFERLRAHRTELFEPEVAKHHGRIFKLMGDGLLAEFGSVVDAVECAAALQAEMAKRNNGLSPDRRIDFRIGIHVGDVIVEGEDRHGDAVNVAARLQQLAEPGAICVSQHVVDHTKQKVALGFELRGEEHLKNIAEPVRVYRVTSTPQGPATTPNAVTDKPSIAVLPFVNMSGDLEQEYFSDGITEDIITTLSKVSQLFVIARNSAFTYKGKAVRVQQIGTELGVRYVVEGSVRKVGGRVRITAQLIDAATGGHLWADRFDRDLTDIFAMQDEVTQEIVSTLAVKLTAGEQRRLMRAPLENIEAYDFFLRGREAWWRHTRDANREARAMFERAIELAPRFSSAYSFLSFTHNQDYVNGWTKSPEHSQHLGYEFAQKAVALDGSDPTARVALGVAHLWMKEHDRAIGEAKASIVLDPNYSLGYMVLGWALHYAGEQEDAIDKFNKAIRNDPHYPGVYLHFLAQAYFMLGQFEDATVLLKRRLLRDPKSDISRVLLAACYGHLGRVVDARAEWAAALRINPEYSLEHRRRVLPYKDPGAFERIVEGLRKAGLPE
jgi:adenylate cyclase